jgi:hypothetical protein
MAVAYTLGVAMKSFECTTWLAELLVAVFLVLFGKMFFFLRDSMFEFLSVLVEMNLKNKGIFYFLSKDDMQFFKSL